MRPRRSSRCALHGDGRSLARGAHDVRGRPPRFPTYPQWQHRPEDVGQWTRDEQVNEVPVESVKMYVPGTPPFEALTVEPILYAVREKNDKRSRSAFAQEREVGLIRGAALKGRTPL
jgi:hypothetical protein